MMFLSFQRKEPEMHQVSVVGRAVLNPQRGKMGRIKLQRRARVMVLFSPWAFLLQFWMLLVLLRIQCL